MGRAGVNAVLLDTHAWSWLLSNIRRLSATALYLPTSADAVWLSPISFYEIVQKEKLGKWPEMAGFAGRLPDLLNQQGGKLADVTGTIAMRAANLAWTHRDPFDRLIAATAIELNVPLLSADAAFDGLKALPDWPGRLW